MEHRIEATWIGRRRFNALVGGHTIVMDAPERVGGEDQGTIPKPLVLTALAGCTGMDVAALLDRSGHALDSLAITVDGELSQGHPMRYTAVRILFDMSGTAESQAAAVAAVERSQRELCGVSAMLQAIMPVRWEVRFNGALVLEGLAGRGTEGRPRDGSDH
ncbi:MAG: OsmC family protein [Flavobacteriales bacterium]|nr:OsmC family protein [Flavobacteriales bacterium]